MKQNYYFFDVEDFQPKITTLGFSLNEKVRAQLLNELIKLADRSPAESHLSLTLIRDKDSFRASLVVNSFSKIFRVRASGKKLSQVFTRVIEKMDGEIDSWKKHRNLDVHHLFVKDRIYFTC